jgi:signal transduction histidine kinase/ActR/RegA family two-component response regulator
MNGFEGLDLTFPREYLRVGLMVSLLSVWVLVVLFYYLNRYTKRIYFTIWTTAWLFYALWLTMGITWPEPAPNTLAFVVKQWCVGTSAIFLLWGSMIFLEIPIRQTLLALFIGFLLVWSYVGPFILDDRLLAQTPIFFMFALASVFVGGCFYRLHRRLPYVGAGLLSVGFLLWGLYLGSYPFSQQYDSLYTAGFLIATVLQLFIAVSMIVLVLEEVRHKHEQTLRQIEAVNSEKEALQLRVLSFEEECKSLYTQAQAGDTLKKAYEELRATQHMVTQQERLRALGQMASGIAHDLNNALSPVVVFSELLLKTETGLRDNARRQLQQILTAGEDIAKMIARMREFYRRREHEPLEPVDLNCIVEEVVNLTRPRWRDIPQQQGVVVKVRMELGKELPTLYGVPSELREALTNLILNSVDALPEGGEIILSTRGLHLNKAATEEADHLLLEVRDTGVGMDQHTRKHCLDPFFTTKGHRGGTGLGLPMVYGLMERHEGSIELDTEPGKGTCVRLIFPRRKPASVEPLRVVDASGPVPSLRILCIDDEPMLRQLLAELLTCQGHEVVTADGGEAGLAAFRSARQDGKPFAVVITDLGMPYVDGRQVTRTIKTESPQTPVILLTGWGTIVNDEQQSPTPVDGIISKPPRMADLNEMLTRVTNQQEHRKVAC